MPRFLDMERARRSVIWAMWSAEKRRLRNGQGGSGARWGLFVTFSGGMQELVDAIASRLPAGAVRLGRPVTKLIKNGDNGWTLNTVGGENIEADGVILAAPAYRSAAILKELDPGLSEELVAIPYASTATISMAYRRADFPRGLDGFGLVVPAVESRKIIACTFSSVKYAGRAPEGHVLLRAFVGGALQPSLAEDSDATIEHNVRQELASLLGVKAEPLLRRIHRHPRAMPQYHVGHQERLQRINTRLNNFASLALAGNAYHGVVIAYCMHSGEEAAETVLRQFQRH